jgi:hypothetical protein
VFFVVIFLLRKIFNHEKREKGEKEKSADTLFSCPFVFFVVIFLWSVVKFAGSLFAGF